MKLSKWENLGAVKYGYTILIELLFLTFKKGLPLRNQLEILLQIYLVEKIDLIRDSISSSLTILPPDHNLFNFLEVILEFVHQIFTVNPQIILFLYLNYDIQLFSIPIVENFFKTISKLVC